MATVTYRGDVAELKGSRWDVPAGVPGSQMAAWIESQHREAQAREAAALAKAEADAEAAAREAELLAARIEAAKSGEEFRSEVESLRVEITDVRQQLESPETADLLAVTASAVTAFNTARDVLERVDEAIATADALQLAAQDLMDEAAAQKQASIDVLKNQQELLNGSFESYRDALAVLEEQTNATEVKVGNLNTLASESAEVVTAAANIRESAVDIARQVARAEMEQTRQEFLALMSLALEAMGVDERTLALHLNSDEADPNRGIFLTSEYLRRLTKIQQGKETRRLASSDGDSPRSRYPSDSFSWVSASRLCR